MDVPNGDHVITTATQRIWLGDDGIVRAVYVAGSEVNGDDARMNIATDAKVAKGKRFPLFVDYTGLRSLSRDARVYVASPAAARVVTAAALFVQSPLSRAIGNFFLGLNKPPYPTRMFTVEEEAIAWLKGYVE